jgi:hypothetical protein
MAIYACARQTWTPSAVADSSTYTINQGDSLLVGAAPRVARVTEAFIGGEAVASTVNVLALRRDQTTAATPANKTPRPINPASQAALTTYYQDATTFNTPGVQHMLQLSLNVFGGVVRWVAPPGGEIYMLGGGALPNTGLSLGAVSGSPGAMSSHLMVEEL